MADNYNPTSFTFWLKVKPRSSRERLGYDGNGELRLELRAPPVEGLANQACIRFFARELNLPQASVTIVSGHKSRHKLIRITGLPAEQALAAIKALGGGE